MNPFLQRLVAKKQTQNNNLGDLMAAISNGSVNPKDMVEKMIGGLNSKQKARLKTALPMLQAFAMKQGASQGEINQMITELQSRM